MAAIPQTPAPQAPAAPVERQSSAASFFHKRQRARRIATIASFIFLGIGSIIILMPLYWQVATSLKTSAQTIQIPPVWFPSPLQWGNYPALLEKFPMGLYAVNSMIISTAVVIGTVLSCSMAAYGFARLRMPGKEVIFIILLSTLMLPAVTLVIPQFVLFQRLQWTNSFKPLIVPAFFGNAFYIFLLRQFFMTIPTELEDAARMDGASYFRIYAQIILPLARPALIAVALFTFVATWNDFFGPLIYLSDERMYTVAVALRYLAGSVRSRPENHLLMAAATLSVIPPLVLFLIAQRQFMQSSVFTGIKG